MDNSGDWIGPQTFLLVVGRKQDGVRVGLRNDEMIHVEHFRQLLGGQVGFETPVRKRLGLTALVPFPPIRFLDHQSICFKNSR